MLSRSVITYSTPSAPLAGTSRLRRKAAYTQCLRCAGAPRRPASGSGLSLTIPAWHAALYDPGEFDHRYGPVLRCRHGLRRDLSGSALPKFPQSASRGARLRGFTGSLPLRPVRLLAPLYGSNRLPGLRGLLLPGFQRDHPVAGYDYNSDWTPLLAGLSPAGMAASLAAPDPGVCC